MTYIIGEIGQNHNGSVDLAKCIIDLISRNIIPPLSELDAVCSGNGKRHSIDDALFDINNDGVKEAIVASIKTIKRIKTEIWRLTFSFVLAARNGNRFRSCNAVPLCDNRHLNNS